MKRILNALACFPFPLCTLTLRSPSKFRRVFHRDCGLFYRELRTVSRQLDTEPDVTLKVRIPRRCDLLITSRDPQDYEGESWKNASVTLDVEKADPTKSESRKVTGVSEEEARRVTSEFGLRVEERRGVILLEAAEVGRPLWLAEVFRSWRSWLMGLFWRSTEGRQGLRVGVNVEVPGKCNLDLEVAQGSIEVHQTFEGNVRIVSDSASVKLNRLKSLYIDLESQSGSIEGAMLQGNVDVRTKWGSIDMKKVQGPRVTLMVGKGDVQVGAIYTERGVLQTQRGDINARAAHGVIYVRTNKGSVKLAGVEGQLDIEVIKGDIDAQISVPRRVCVKSSAGDVALGLPAAVRARVYLEGATNIDVSEAFRFAVVDGQDESFIDGILESKDVVADSIESGEESDMPSVVAQAPTGGLVVSQREWMSFPNGAFEQLTGDSSQRGTIANVAPTKRSERLSAQDVDK